MESRSVPDPRATMRPTISWPMITGSSTFKASEPCQRWTSVPQIEHVSIRVRIAPGSISFGMGTSSIHRGVRNCRTTAALLYDGTVLSMAGLLLQSGLVLGLRQNSLQNTHPHLAALGGFRSVYYYPAFERRVMGG